MRSNRRRKNILIALGALVALFAIIGIASGKHSPAPGTSAASSASSAGQSASTQAQQILSWWQATGQSDNDTITSDLQQLSTDAGDGDQAAVESDGSQLAADASSVLGDPMPPGQLGADWSCAMHAYETSGTDASNGDFTEAATAAQQGNTCIGKATAYVKSLPGS
jgi:hypothetical protein